LLMGEHPSPSSEPFGGETEKRCPKDRWEDPWAGKYKKPGKKGAKGGPRSQKQGGGTALLIIKKGRNKPYVSRRWPGKAQSLGFARSRQMRTIGLVNKGKNNT